MSRDRVTALRLKMGKVAAFDESRARYSGRGTWRCIELDVEYLALLHLSDIYVLYIALSDCSS
jgi:hypothetical protein